MAITVFSMSSARCMQTSLYDRLTIDDFSSFNATVRLDEYALVAACRPVCDTKIGLLKVVESLPVGIITILPAGVSTVSLKMVCISPFISSPLRIKLLICNCLSAVALIVKAAYSLSGRSTNETSQGNSFPYSTLLWKRPSV